MTDPNNDLEPSRTVAYDGKRVTNPLWEAWRLRRDTTSADRFYPVTVHLVIGSIGKLSLTERRKLLREVRATLAVHLDIAAVLGRERVTGSAYIAGGRS